MKVNANGWGRAKKVGVRGGGEVSHKRAEAVEAVRAIFRVSDRCNVSYAVITLCRYIREEEIQS